MSLELFSFLSFDFEAFGSKESCLRERLGFKRHLSKAFKSKHLKKCPKNNHVLFELAQTSNVLWPPVER